ncbi:MAG: hypothetical protein WDW38_005723 [Sanguina aurantia]
MPNGWPKGGPLSVATQTSQVTEPHKESTTGAGSAAPATATAQKAAKAAPVFQWTKCWWPASVVDYLDPARPTAVTIMGINLVLWYDKGKGPGSGVAPQWRAFKDSCPHRMAPLSEGRLEADGTLQCSYHGWRFQGDGKCTAVPQSIDPRAEATALTSSRSCAKAYPTSVKAGLLWVWTDSSPTAGLEAAAAPQVVSNAAVARSLDPAASPIVWTMRDVPYSYEVLVENLSDPAHLPYSHHGVGSLTRSRGTAMPMSTLSQQQLLEIESKLPANMQFPDMCVDKAVLLAAATSRSSGSSSSTPHSGSSQEQQNGHTSSGSGAAAAAAAAAPMSHLLAPEMFAFEGTISKDARVTFHAPSLISYLYSIAPGVRMQVDTMSVPTSPGRARAFVANHMIAAPPPPKPAPNPIQQLGALLQMLQPANLAKAMRMAVFKWVGSPPRAVPPAFWVPTATHHAVSCLSDG